MKLTRATLPATLPALTLSGTGLIVLFALVHTVSDAITNMLSALLPTLQSRFALSNTTLALLVASLSLSALLTQPLFGALADKLGARRVAALGVIFNAILFSLIGIVPDLYLLFGLILVGGLGSAALHPAMASMARRAGGKKSDVAVGLFSAGGTVGVAVGPLIIMGLLANFGLTVTPWLMLPGIGAGLLLFALSPADTPAGTETAKKLFDGRLLTRPVGLLSLTGILTNVALVTFTSAMPLWLVQTHALPNDSVLIGWTLSTFSLAAAGGGILGGLLSNRVGAQRVIMTSAVLALLPLAAIFSLTPGSGAYFMMVALAGALMNAGMPVLIVSAQDLAPKNAATASGMLMGFSAGASGLVYVGIGRLQEGLGLVPAMGVGYLALLLAAGVASLAFQTRQPANPEFAPAPIKAMSCLCASCLDQNIATLPQRG